MGLRVRQTGATFFPGLFFSFHYYFFSFMEIWELAFWDWGHQWSIFLGAGVKIYVDSVYGLWRRAFWVFWCLGYFYKLIIMTLGIQMVFAGRKATM